MSTQSKITMSQLIAVRKTFKEENGRTQYTDQFKRMVISFHYQNGVSMQVIGKTLDIHENLISKWKRTFGHDQTAFVHGKTMRMDVRTKALAVQEHIIGKIKPAIIATKYNVSYSTMLNWINKYSENFQDLLDAPDGIPYIVKEKKMVYGKTNIDKIRDVLRQQAETLMALIDSMHMNEEQADHIRKAAEATMAKEKPLADAANLLEENGIDLK